MKTARLLQATLALTAITTAANAVQLPTGGFIAVGDVGNATATSDTVTFYSTDDLSSRLFSVALPFESASNNEDFDALTVNPFTGEVYVTAVDSGTPGTVVTTTDLQTNVQDTDGDLDLYRIDFAAFYNDWVNNQNMADVTYHAEQNDSFFGDPVFSGAPNPIQATGDLGTNGIQKIGEIARSQTFRSNTSDIFNKSLAFIDDDTLVYLDEDTDTSGSVAADHEIRLIKRISGPASYDSNTNEGGFNSNTAESWTSTIVGRVLLDGDTNASEPRTIAGYKDPQSGVTGVWVLEGDGGGDDIGFFEIVDESGDDNGPGGSNLNGYRLATTGLPVFALDNDPANDPTTNDGSGDRVLVNPVTGDLIIMESGFFDSPQHEPSVIQREVVDYDASGEILFGAWSPLLQIDGNQPGDDDTQIVDGRYTAYDHINNVLYYHDRDNPFSGGGGSYDGDWWSINLTTGETKLEATDVGNFQIYDNGTFLGFFSFDQVGIEGDYDNDGELTDADVDLLVNAILAGSTDLTYDANSDGVVDANDYILWRDSLYGTTAGDANLDFVVDLLDLSLLASNFDGPGLHGEGDFNADGLVDLLDLSLLASNFDTGNVPEPAGLALLGLGAAAMLRRQA
ncbi:PEP-CTERM sorting domain-containing protein [Mucisphaera calidilacus]|uniref:Ice-binding protein C-terminal domain-containing protein n=1 Tax=Mucisphaera calidilacus TaxID=2527982 RepID=A0A518BUU3_9BACT|nr:PEP-CTERM sorting domain-containing protein [Mucisphaera calidilacus]QDU70752.1 hypothetical protein Pan265_05870 [Mucisphaera calidilacus]